MGINWIPPRFVGTGLQMENLQGRDTCWTLNENCYGCGILHPTGLAMSKSQAFGKLAQFFALGRETERACDGWNLATDVGRRREGQHRGSVSAMQLGEPQNLLPWLA